MRKYIVLSSIAIIVIFNLFLSYVLMWNPYELYFNRPEFSETHYKTRDKLAFTISIIHFILLWAALIWTFTSWRVKNTINIIALIFSGFTFWMLMEVQEYYPDSNHEWTENGYRYKTQKWYLDGNRVYKKWKSRDSLENYNNHREIIWEFDSLSKK